MSSITVIGGTNIDWLARSFRRLIPRDSNPGTVSYSFGGVSHNVACNLGLLDCAPQFITAFSEDPFGVRAAQDCRQAKVLLDHAQVIPGYPSSQYIAIVEPDGDMNIAVSDLEILYHLDVAAFLPYLESLTAEDLLVLDTNLTPPQIKAILEHCPAKLYSDPVSVSKSDKIAPYLDRLQFFKPNRLEAEHLSGLPCRGPEDYLPLLDWFLAHGVRQIAVSLGSQGIIAAAGKQAWSIANAPVPVVSTTGAGDAFLAGYVYAAGRQRPFIECLQNAMAASFLTIASSDTVCPAMSPAALQEEVRQFSAVVQPQRLR